MKRDDENAKDKRWNTPVDLPGVRPEDYKKDRDGTAGFSPQYAGHAKAAHDHTTSFDVEKSNHASQSNPSKAAAKGAGSAQRREPTASVTGRILKG
jgi:hypothetical protein